MINFINIDGQLINLDNVTSISCHEKGDTFSSIESNLYIMFDSMNNEEMNDLFIKGKNAKRAYEWLKSNCVVSFTDETE